MIFICEMNILDKIALVLMASKLNLKKHALPGRLKGFNIAITYIE